jgi:hypothetical protein
MPKNERFVFKGTKWVKWHPEYNVPPSSQEGFMCDYHFRVALDCRMVEQYGAGQAESTDRDCFFCRLPEREV